MPQLWAICLFLLAWNISLAEISEKPNARQQKYEDAKEEAKKGNNQKLMPNMMNHLMNAQKHREDAQQARQQKNEGKARQDEQMARMEQQKAQQLQQQINENNNSANKNQDGAKKVSETSDAAQKQMANKQRESAPPPQKIFSPPPRQENFSRQDTQKSVTDPLPAMQNPQIASMDNFEREKQALDKMIEARKNEEPSSDSASHKFEVREDKFTSFEQDLKQIETKNSGAAPAKGVTNTPLTVIGQSKPSAPDSLTGKEGKFWEAVGAKGKETNEEEEGITKKKKDKKKKGLARKNKGKSLRAQKAAFARKTATSRDYQKK